MMLKSWWNGLLDLVAPQDCMACEEQLGPGASGLCPTCTSLLDPREHLEGGRAAFLYGGPIRDAIVRFKYTPTGSSHATPLGRLLTPAALQHAGAVDRVMPVPLHPRRLRARGYNQSALLARAAARALSVPLVTSCLRRRRDTPPQASLERGERLANVRGAFEARATSGRVLLVDDVRTTGSTLAECAAVLRGAGATEVRTLVLAAAEG